MSSKKNIAAQEAFGEAVNTGNLEALNDLVSAAVVDHDPASGQGPGPQGYRDMFSELRTAFPDLHIEVDHLTADGDDVAFAYTMSGTHLGPLKGHAPTGKSVGIRGLQISRFENEQLIERWGSSDELGMMTQLGLLSP